MNTIQLSATVDVCRCLDCGCLHASTMSPRSYGSPCPQCTTRRAEDRVKYFKVELEAKAKEVRSLKAKVTRLEHKLVQAGAV